MEISLPKRRRTRTPRRKHSPPDAAGAPAEVSKERRRSERISTHIPTILLGKDAAGREFFDRSEIISVDGRGARMRTRFLLRLGTILEVQLTNEMVTKRMRVVWQGDRGSPYEGMVGLEFEDQNDTWSLRMLRARWELGT
jgi:PilZ domain-containing protein